MEDTATRIPDETGFASRTTGGPRVEDGRLFIDTALNTFDHLDILVNGVVIGEFGEASKSARSPRTEFYR